MSYSSALGYNNIGKKYKSISGYNMLDSWLHPDRGYKDAEKAAQRRWKEAQGYEEPYWQRGIDQMGVLNEAENRLLHPMELENEWAKDYEESPYAKYLQQENMGKGLDAASSMGLMGSSGALNNIQQGAGKITAMDRYKFMQDLMDKYMKGVGLGSSIYGTGANAANALATGSQDQGTTEANLEYGKNAAQGQRFGEIVRLIASFFGGGMGGMGGGGAGGMGGG